MKKIERSPKLKRSPDCVISTTALLHLCLPESTGYWPRVSLDEWQTKEGPRFYTERLHLFEFWSGPLAEYTGYWSRVSLDEWQTVEGPRFEADRLHLCLPESYGYWPRVSVDEWQTKRDQYLRPIGCISAYLTNLTYIGRGSHLTMLTSDRLNRDQDFRLIGRISAYLNLPGMDRGVLAVSKVSAYSVVCLSQEAWKSGCQ